MSDSSELPALNHLGYGIDMTTVTPLTIDSVTASIKRGFRLFIFDDDTHEVQAGGVKYTVPSLVTVGEDTKSSECELQTYESGSKASEAFNVDASLSVTYGAISGSASASYAYSKSFSQESMFALFSNSYNVYYAALENYGDSLNENPLAKRLKKLPIPFDGSDPKCVSSYKSFFHTWGSHIVLSCNYGSRFQMTVQQSRSDSETSTDWSANVKAAYNGVVAVDADVSVKSSDSYKAFDKSKVLHSVLRGGDISYGPSLEKDPPEPEAFKSWTNTAMSNPDITNFSTIEIWSLMEGAESDVINNYANEIENAYNWCLQNPQRYTTEISFNIESDWAEFGLLTPSATISDPKGLDDDNTVAGDLKITWGREHSHDEKRKTIEFAIVNDGSPLDFYISHGSDGSTGGTGNARVIIQGKEYANEGVSDNNWNTKRFYQAPVSGTPVTDDEK